VAGTILIHQGFSPMILVGWRFLAAAIVTLPLVLLDGGAIRTALLPARAGLREVGLVILIGLVQTTAVMGLLYWAMQSISASTAAILLNTNPIWVGALGGVLLGEDLHRERLAGLFLGIIGVAFAIGLDREMLAGGKTLMGEGIGLASAFCWAGATIINKRADLPLGP
jgi:drug/metabolite transporter (DMT)-like permease